MNDNDHVRRLAKACSKKPITKRARSRNLIGEYGPFVFGGTMLIIAFAFAGHYMGKSSLTYTADTGLENTSIAFISKGSLLPAGDIFDYGVKTQRISSNDKTDLIETKLTQAAIVNSNPIVIEAALQEDVMTEDEAAFQRKTTSILEKPAILIASPAQVEKSFKLKRALRRQNAAVRNVLVAEENCLARAVYFEARSESDAGQLAVAKVILNRVQDPNYPKTICGVVYQGTQSRDSCQFSFACDGLPDEVKSPTAWLHAKLIARKAISGAQSAGIMNSATNYHADYVQPKWARSMRRLIKIGTHIFYSSS